MKLKSCGGLGLSFGPSFIAFLANRMCPMLQKKVGGPSACQKVPGSGRACPGLFQVGRYHRDVDS